MWTKNKYTEIVGTDYPIVQGPFGGGLSSAELVAAVSNSGGLGGYGAYNLQPEEIIEINNQIKSLTDKSYALNLWISDIDKKSTVYSKEDFEKLKLIFEPYYNMLGIPLPEMPDNVSTKYERQVETILDIKPPVFSFIFGIPSKEILQECRKREIVTIGAATTIDEAMALEEAEVDLIVASGFEAGGHRPSFLRSAEDSLTGTFALIPQIVDRVKTPVIAAGGIADGRGIAAAFTLGASAVQIGTAFLACEESNAPQEHKQMIFSDKSKYSTLTKVFTGRLARGIKSKISEAGKFIENEIAPFPLQSKFISPLRSAALKQKKTELITFWAGQAAPIVKEKNARELMLSLIDEVDVIYERMLMQSQK